MVVEVAGIVPDGIVRDRDIFGIQVAQDVALESSLATILLKRISFFRLPLGCRGPGEATSVSSWSQSGELGFKKMSPTCNDNQKNAYLEPRAAECSPGNSDDGRSRATYG